MGGVPNWSALPPEMLTEIAGRLKMAEDFAAFRGICTTWRAAATKDIFAGVSKVPLLMLEKKGDNSNERQLFSFPSNRIVMTISLPEVESKRCIGAGFGWLLIQTVTEEVSLLNPISGAQIHLPSLADFPVYDLDRNFVAGFHPPTILRAVLSSNPSADPSNFALVIIVRTMMLCCWRVGDETWTKKDADDLLFGGFASVGFCGGKFYILEWVGDLIVWDPLRKDGFNVIMNFDFSFDNSKLYLVESCDGKLLLLRRKFAIGYEDINEFKTVRFEVIKIDVTKREWRLIFDMENCALFAGDNVVICIDASCAFPDVIKPNCIYFTEDSNESREIPEDMGIYNVGNMRIERFNVESFGFVSPPLWIDSSIITKSESFHI